jgi:hypothetical protein
MARVRIRGRIDLAKVARSPEISAQLEPVADDVLGIVRQDSNDEFTSTLRKKQFVTRGRSGRVSWQVGAAPQIGRRVEAKRGVFARALGRMGLN